MPFPIVIRTAAIAAPILFATCLATTASAQVVLSEIDFVNRSGVGPWIEIANRGSASVDLSTWSVYFESRTQNTVQNYWWGFPRGTTINAGKFLRVHWFVDKQAQTATDVYTGKRVSDFLFGLWAEPLTSSSGAIGLLSTQTANQVNLSSVYRDWVQWGSTGFRRSSIAVAAGLWTSNSQAAGDPSAQAPSLAFDYRNSNGRRSGAFWFRDTSPTPLADNLGGAAATAYGSACQGQLGQSADLSTVGLPVLGNREFRLRATRTLVSGEIAVGFYNARGPGQLKLLSCPYLLDPTGPAFAQVMLPDSDGLPNLSFRTIPDTALAGAKIATQWAYIDLLRFAAGLTRGIELQFGQ